MIARPTAPSSDMLHAYVDGRLDPDARAEVEHYLREHPDAAALVSEWSAQNDALSALFPASAVETVLARLDPRHLARELRENRARGWRNMAAAIALVLIGSGVGWFGRDYLTASQAASDRLIDAAIEAHTLYVKEKLHAVEVAADVPHLMSWLSNRIETRIDAPNVSDEGFSFMGGRLLPGDTDDGLPGPVAQLMYQNAGADRLTVSITPALADRHAGSQYVERRDVDAFYWSTDTITCTVVGDLPDAQMQAIASKIFRQLSWRPDPRQ